MAERRPIFAPFVAIVASLASLSCCLPLAFLAALGTAGAGAGAFLQTLSPWLLGLSVALLGVGFWQQRRAKQCAVKRSYVSAVLVWAAVVVVAGMILFPQEIAGFLADRLAGAWK